MTPDELVTLARLEIELLDHMIEVKQAEVAEIDREIERLS